MSTQMLGIQFGYNHYVLKANMAELSQEDSLTYPEPGGNCMNWVVGHILATRNSVLKTLGEEPIWGQEEAERYGRGSVPIKDRNEAVPFERMQSDLDLSQKRIVSGLETFDPSRLSEPAPFSPVNREGETVGSLLAGLVFHEAYHAGQTGVLRRIAGKASVLT